MAEQPKTPVADPLAANASRLARRFYLPRVVGLTLGGLGVAAGLWQAVTPAWVWLLMGLHVLVWPHLAHVLARRSARPREQETVNLLIDSFSGGFWVMAMQLNALPSVMIVAMLCMNNVGIGGRQLLSRGLLAQLLGLGLGALGLGWKVQLNSTLLTQLACLPFLVIYPAMIGTVMFRLARELTQSREQVKRMSERDQLAGTYNRSFFEEQLAREFDNFRRHGHLVTLVMADLDHFKSINDQSGHAAGDEVLREFGRALQAAARQGDLVARYGGDEFAVLLPFTGTEDALNYVERVRSRLAAEQAQGPQAPHASASFGIAAPHEAMNHRDRWVELADVALYRAKERARGSVEIAPHQPYPPARSTGSTA